MTMRKIILAAAATALIGQAALAQQQPQQPQGPTIEQRVGYEIGPIIVRAAALAAQVDQAKTIIEQRDKTIADLQAQIEALKKPAEAPK